MGGAREAWVKEERLLGGLLLRAASHFTPVVTLDGDIEHRVLVGTKVQFVLRKMYVPDAVLKLSVSEPFACPSLRPIAGHHLLFWTQLLPFFWPSLGSHADWL